jgi:hypothetical protein
MSRKAPFILNDPPCGGERQGVHCRHRMVPRNPARTSISARGPAMAVARDLTLIATRWRGCYTDSGPLPDREITSEIWPP